MYTLNLKDINIDPKITEDKIFEGSSENEVLNMVTSYINENYKDMYNPYSLQRKCTEAVLHNGANLMQEQKDNLTDLSEKWASEDGGTSKEKDDLYEEKAKAVYKKYDDQKEQLSQTLDEKAKELNFDTDGEEYKKAQEEYQAKKESLEWEQDKELKALYTEIHGE